MSGEKALRMPLAYKLVVDLALLRGVRSIKDMDGLLEMEIDESWKVRVNGHPEEIDGVPYGCMVFEYLGWPAGVLSINGGLVAAGTKANERTLTLALRKAIREQRRINR